MSDDMILGIAYGFIIGLVFTAIALQWIYKQLGL